MLRTRFVNAMLVSSTAVETTDGDPDIYRISIQRRVLRDQTQRTDLGSRTDRDVDVLTFILWANGVPVGDIELPTSSVALQRILMSFEP